MLTLYSKETTSFSTLGIGVLRDFISNPLITEELNGAYTLEFQYAKDGYLSEYLIEQNIVKANGQAFRIWNVKKDMQKITILAKHIFFDLSFNFLSDVYPKNLTAQGALSWLINHAAVETNFNVSGNCTETASGRYVRKTVIDAIFNEDNALLKRFGGELSYNNYNITVHEHRGTNANFSIRYKKNLTGIDFNLDFSNVATRIVPIGFDGITIPSTYVESGKVSNYFTPLYKTYEFSDIKYDPDDEEAYHTMAEAQAALTNAANDLFTKGVDLPQISISVNFVELSKCTEYSNYSNLESVNLGDTIDVIIPELNINTTARVNKTVYDCILERYITLDIGSAKQSVTRTQINIENQVKKSENFLTQAQQNAENLINHPFNGNVLIDKENGVIYLMDSTNPETAQNVWKWSLGGLGFSSTGINGTYTVAILQDGRINADFITTGQLDTGVIQGYDSLVIQVNGLETEFEKEITPTKNATGTSFYLEDSTNAELVNFEMEGKTTQATSESPVMPSPDYPSELISVGYENYFEAEYLQTTANTNINANLYKDTYTLSLESKENFGGVIYIQLYKNNTLIATNGHLLNTSSAVLFSTSSYWYYFQNIPNGNKLTFTLDDDYSLKIALSNATGSQKAMLVKGTQEHSYIPYGKYGIEVISTKEILLDKLWEQKSFNYLTGELGTSTTANIIRSGAYEVKPNTQYTFKCNANLGEIAVFYYQEDKTTVIQGLNGYTNNKYWSFKTPSNAYYVYIRIGSSTSPKSATTNYDQKLEENNVFLYTLNQPLRSIGDVKDLLYIKNGMLYVERKIGSVVFKGTETWNLYSSNTVRTIFYTPISQQMESYTLTTDIPKLMSSHFIPASQNATWKNGDISRRTNENNIYLIVANGYTIDTFKTWLSTHNTEVQYILAEPTTEELGKVDMPSTYKTITHIDTVDINEPNMNITYVRDTQISNYVEEHISQIIVNEEGITQRVQTIEDSDYDEKINEVEERIKDNEVDWEIISRHIDKTTGDVREITTSNGMTLNENGLNIHTNQSTFNAQHTFEGTYYRDGEKNISYTNAEGFMASNMKNQGQHLYSFNNTNSENLDAIENYDFIDERIEVNSEYCYATFYNGEE